MTSKGEFTDNMTGFHAPSSPSSRPHAQEPLLSSQIRILVLLSGMYGDPLEGMLEVHSVDEKPRFKAISYVCGEPVFPHTLRISRHEFKISRSLFGALRRFRREKEATRLWADAICIDQDNVEEKNHQVAKMDEIYRLAEQVLVWLGEEKDSDCLAACSLNFLTEYHRHRCDRNGLVDYLKINELTEACEKQIVNWGHHFCCTCGNSIQATPDLSLVALFNALAESIWSREWFKRLWTAQEIAVADSTTFFYGRHETISENIWGVAYMHHDYCKDVDTAFDIVSTWDAVQRPCKTLTIIQSHGFATSYGKEQDLLSSIHFTSELLAQEPHDRIYAIRALAHVRDVGILRPDYNLPLSELWRRATVFVLSTRSNWDSVPDLQCPHPTLVLACVGTQPRLQSMTSWVPDFANLTAESRKRYEYYTQRGRKNQAGGTASVEVHFSPEQPDLLQLRGVLLGRICKLCHGSEHYPITGGQGLQPRPDEYWKGVKNKVLPWYFRCCQFARDGQCREDEGRWAKLPTFYAVRAGGIKPNMPSYEEFCTAMADMDTYGFKFSHTTAELRGMWEEIEPFVRWSNLSTADYAYASAIMASTEDGHVGWVPTAAKPGDIVCLFQGCPFPFVIRDRDDGFYTMIGDAYIHCFRHGKAWPRDTSKTCLIGLR